MKTSALRITLAVLAIFGFAARGSSQSTSPILEKKFAFPWPVVWKEGGNMDISLTAVAWGPANSPEMLSKAKGLAGDYRAKPKFFPDRPYVLALHLRAKVPFPVNMGTPSHLFRVKNNEGDLEPPMALTPQGFVPATLIQLDYVSEAEWWEFFPVPPGEKYFLFQISQRLGPNGSWSRTLASFKILLRNSKFRVINATPGALSACPHFTTQKFTGTIGANIKVSIQLTREGTKLFGTEQYARIGKTLWLKGAADFNDNFRLRESYPENHVTGIFHGKFTQRCEVMVGFFSKPDGSRLQPFKFLVPGAR